ncbi:chaplin family protein [Streptomyces sp. NPDC057694]|uniref:chaplin n=1 Tax=Streptomyces sp. NPDC057694 TaxID=3346216 RepID=UPI0036BA641C
MRQALKIGVMAAAAATGMLSMPGASAAALTGDEGDAGASTSAADTQPEEHGYGETSPSETTANSPGLLSGNTVQAPVDIGLNLCGNTADVVGALNPSTGNACAGSGDASAAPAPAEEHLPPSAPATPATPVTPVAPSTPVQPPTGRSVPVPAPVHVDRPEAGREVLSPAAAPAEVRAPGARERLADTGADPNLLAAAAASAGLLVGGGILYRRSSATRR